MLVCARLEVAFVAIRRPWPLSIAVISGLFYSAPTWVALLLLAVFFQRSEYLAPLVVAVVATVATGTGALTSGCAAACGSCASATPAIESVKIRPAAIDRSVMDFSSFGYSKLK